LRQAQLWSVTRRSPGRTGASLIGAGIEYRSKDRSVNWRLMTVMTVVVMVVPMMPGRLRLPVPSREPVPSGIVIVVWLAIAVDVAVKSMTATARHFDNVRHCWSAGLRDGWTGIRRHRGSTQSQGTEQRQNCCTHRSRPSRLHRNNNARNMQLVPGSALIV
jgi:hypothetical protein